MPTSAPFTILLLDDQGLVRAGMRELIRLSVPHATIHEAASYEEALAWLDQLRFDIAFLDLNLKSDKSGLDFLKFLRATERDTRAIILSSHSERELVIECLNAGAAGFILKDMDSKGVFLRALDTVFQGGIFLPAELLTDPQTSPAPLPASASTLQALGVSGRAMEVLYYLCQGLPNKSIARKMGIEEGTIRKDYMPKLFRIFHAARRTELMMEVYRRGIIIPPPPPQQPD
jgi:two-component system nitrate/nitrite response regulator NarL